MTILGVVFADRIRLATYDLLGHYCDGWGRVCMIMAFEYSVFEL